MSQEHHLVWRMNERSGFSFLLALSGLFLLDLRVSDWWLVGLDVFPEHDVVGGERSADQFQSLHEVVHL